MSHEVSHSLKIYLSNKVTTVCSAVTFSLVLNLFKRLVIMAGLIL